jgi:hypothetical protein
VDHVQDPILFRRFMAPGNEPGTSGSAATNSGYSTIEWAGSHVENNRSITEAADLRHGYKHTYIQTYITFYICSLAVNLSFLGRSRFFLFVCFVYPQEAVWTPFQTHYYSEKLAAPGFELGSS